MTQEYEKPELFSQDEAPLPIHVLMIRDMTMPRYNIRLSESKAARAKKYDCYQFYKHISRPLPLTESNDDD